MIHEAYVLNEFIWFYREKKYENYDDFRQNAKHRDGIVAVAIDPNCWKEEWGAPTYLVTRFDNDDFVEKPGLSCSSTDFNFVKLLHYQYYVEEFLYGVRKVKYNVVAIISYWEGMSDAYRAILKSRDAGGLEHEDLLKDFEPLDMKNERNQELCRMALSGERSDHEYPECNERLRFCECKIVDPHEKCIQLLDENRCPLSKIWKKRKKFNKELIPVEDEIKRSHCRKCGATFPGYHTSCPRCYMDDMDYEEI